MNYYGTDPARYAMHQQSRQDQRMSNLLNMMMQMQAIKQRQQKWEEDKLQWQREQKRKESATEALNKWYTHLQEPKQTLPWQEQLSRDLIKREAEEAIKAKYREPKAPPYKLTPEGKLEAQIKKDRTRIENLYKQYDKERTRYISQMKSVENPNAKLKLQTTLRNLDRGLNLLTLMGDLVDKGSPLSEDAQKKLNNLLNINRIKREGLGDVQEVSAIDASTLPPGTQIAENEETGEQIAYVNGQWIRIK